jgi:hypothetical protein
MNKINLIEVKQPVVATLQGPGPHDSAKVTREEIEFFKSVSSQSNTTKKLILHI